MGKLYIAYGSNINISQMKYRCPKAKFVCTKVLKDVRLVFRRNGGGYCNLEKFKGGRVPVVIWEITDNDEKALDRYEGYPTYYVKRNVTLNIAGEGKKQAMMYVMNKRYEDEVYMPRRDYFEIIRCGYEKFELELQVLYAALRECTNEFYLLED